ncbi:ArgS-related anticodon-binding protein NrtL [Streptomyces poriferorum]|uniref:arginine--tRNA ligase n=1 Tax=Streptomyces poriferorum TaxID=2798799 RepID=A0ABY9IM87_9ACTN|nr:MULTISPECIES: DALR anticodon-binding domain-containing protein [unclassified Streptomyces]MDP5314745.1 DALR anticodon-binding domain-containing protein [Streptomyces sp. Alt4]WLQ56361.1 DALR anticodon-binding domain-containing protein [Streptomyces sp. Alt2]
MTPADLSLTVLRAVRRAVDENALHAPVPARVRVERTRPGGRGDYASAVALQLAGPAALSAREVAEILRERVAGAPGIGRVEITGPGFLNFTLDGSADAYGALMSRVREQGPRYGHGDALAGDLLRFSHASEVRAAVTADAVGRLARAQGARVHIGCDGAPDPDWARLGIVGDGEDPSATEIRPVPAGATAGELLRRLGPDATRWGLLRPAGHDRAPLGDDLLVQGEGNALFLVRYAHSRVHALTRGAELLGFTSASGQEAPGIAGAEADALLALLADHPAALLAAARHRAPDRLARHLEAVARALLDFHDVASPLPVGDEKPSAAHRSRLALAEAAGTVLAGGLSLLGISAPRHL